MDHYSVDTVATEMSQTTIISCELVKAYANPSYNPSQWMDLMTLACPHFFYGMYVCREKKKIPTFPIMFVNKKNENFQLFI